MSIIDNLQNPELIQSLDGLSKMIFEQDLIVEAGELIDTINDINRRNPELKREAPKLYDIYQTYLAKAKFVYLPKLGEIDILELMEKHFQLIFDEPLFDIYEKIKDYLKGVDSLEARDEFKKKVRDALLKNNYKIGENKIKLGSLMQEPRISNWLKDYYAKLGIDRVDTLASNQYLVNDVNSKNLSDEDRSKIKILVSFFEKLKRSSGDRGGLEESFVAILPDNKVGIIDGGVPRKIDQSLEHIIEDIMANESNNNIDDDFFIETDDVNLSSETAPIKEPNNTPLMVLSSALENYSPSSLEYKAIKQEIARLRKQKNNDEQEK
ncbi:MAG: hypothetical protein PHE20_00365 [Patescibacteria group bacterium]|nr:hypothetical protein [Patescibacteria group bacterium]